MSRFMKLSKLNRLMQQSQQRIVSPTKEYAPQFQKGYDSDPTVIGRYDWVKINQPKMFSVEPDEGSFKSRNILKIKEQKQQLRDEMDQILEFLRIKNTNQLEKILANVKGNNVDEKIFRSLEYDINSFKQLNGENK